VHQPEVGDGAMMFKNHQCWAEANVAAQHDQCKAAAVMIDVNSVLLKCNLKF